HIALFTHSRSAYLVGRSADHQPNARSAQTGEADKLMGRSADHDPTGWDALRSITSLSSLILALLTWWGTLRTINQTREAHKPARPTNSWDALRTMTQLRRALRGPSHRSLHSFSLCLPGGALCGPSTKRAKRTNRRGRQTHGTLCGP